MPHITVEYSDAVTDAFDRPAFAKDLHEALVTIAGGRAAGCKTRFVRLDETYLADGSPHHAMIHAELALFAGRPPEVKRELTGAVLALLRRHTAPTPALELQFSVDFRDLDRDAYAKHDEPRVTV
ncbi:5-carboxymethyl-2-hydroxymuconate Delta-isomerase [Streptomyces sp. NBC_01190]|uniref:5-carboxymethyl-2-hydroxymuconate Delta-isomerase n=1 Tax=Streptomyces sp. NBC_01190 TaxID=2903767 RepID=UPI00386E95B3|nr:isomerase [Streptomyces sp. NBC_01190]